MFRQYAGCNSFTKSNPILECHIALNSLAKLLRSWFPNTTESGATGDQMILQGWEMGNHLFVPNQMSEYPTLRLRNTCDCGRRK